MALSLRAILKQRLDLEKSVKVGPSDVTLTSCGATSGRKYGEARHTMEFLAPITRITSPR